MFSFKMKTEANVCINDPKFYTTVLINTSTESFFIFLFIADIKFGNLFAAFRKHILTRLINYVNECVIYMIRHVMAFRLEVEPNPYAYIYNVSK